MNRLWTLVLLCVACTSATAQTLTGDRVRLNTGPCILQTGSGSPEGVIVGRYCDLYVNTVDGVLWEKWSASSNTGWSVGHNANERVNGNADVTGYVGKPGYVSQTTGWRIDAFGAADFRYLFTDELHAKSFIADLEQALAGSQIISKSVAMLATNFTNPDPGATATITVRDLPSAENMAAFESGDTIRLRAFSRAAGSLTVADSYGVVTAYTDQLGGVQNWTFTRNSVGGGGMSGGTIIQADAIVLDYGVSGNGFHEVNAIDGVYGVNSPYSQVVTWSASPIPANLTVRSRIGNLRGITGNSNEYGVIAGTYAATDGHYFRASNLSFELHGIDLSLWQGSTKTIYLNNSVPSLAIGSGVPTGYSTGTGIWMGNDSGTYKFRAGIPGGAGVFWNGSTLAVNGAITATSGTIGGWSINATSLTDLAGVVGMSSAVTGGDDIRFFAGNATPSSAPFRVTEAGVVTATSGTIGGWTLGATSFTAGSAGTTVGLDSGGTNPALYAGSATPSSAPFRVTNAGALTATNATITGAVTATSGAIGGCSLSASTLTCGSTSLDSGGITIVNGSGSVNRVNWNDGSWVGADGNNIVLHGSSSAHLQTGSYELYVSNGGYVASGGGHISLGNGFGGGDTWFGALFLEGDVHINNPSTTTANDYPMVYSTGNRLIYEKTDGYDGTCNNPTSIVIERGIVTGCS